MGFQRSKKHWDEASLYEYAIGALGRRMRSVAELKRLMRQRVGPGEYEQALVELVVARLKQEKYLNDANYAASYSQFRRENEKFGKRRVITDLKARGVHGEVIDKAVAEAYDGTNEEALARAYLKRKRLKKPANEKEAARIFRSLARAGFAARVIVTILKRWDVDEEVLTALEEEPQ